MTTPEAANAITGSNVKDESLTGADIKNGSLFAGDINPAVVKWFTGTFDNTVTSSSVKDGSLNVVDLSPAAQAALKGVQGDKGLQGDTGATGATGKQGDKGDSYLTGSYYSVAYYDKGDTNAGAIATVSCKAETDTAISGGVSVDDYTKNTPVSQSFPGRMDWTTNTPKPNRLDGWVIQFGGGAIAPEKVKVWALCVPGLSVPVVQTYVQSAEK